MYWTPAKMLLLADVDEYNFASAAYLDVIHIGYSSTNWKLIYKLQLSTKLNCNKITMKFKCGMLHIA